MRRHARRQLVEHFWWQLVLDLSRLFAHDEHEVMGAITGTPPARMGAAHTALTNRTVEPIGSASGQLYMPIAWVHRCL